MHKKKEKKIKPLVLVKAGANLPKISFKDSVASKVDIGFSLEASAKGATSVIFNGKGGITDKGIYI